MSLRRRAVWCLAIFAILGMPRTGHAGLADLIWEMSGPRLFGIGVECNIWVARENPYCTFMDLVPLSPDSQDQKWYWLSVEARGYLSTGNEQRVNDDLKIEFEPLQTWMVGFDPMLNAGGWGFGSVRFRHGAGGSINFLFGDFRRFRNESWKLRPVVIGFNLNGTPVEFIWDVRLYSEGFDGDPSRPGHLSKGDAFERVYGFTLGFPLRRMP